MPSSATALRQQVDERLVGVGVLPRGPDRRGVRPRCQPGGRGGEDAAGHGDQRRRERRPTPAPRRPRRGSARSPGCAGARRRRRTAQRSPGPRSPSRCGLSAFARARRAAGQDGDDVSRLDHARGEPRREARVTAVTLQPGTAMRLRRRAASRCFPAGVSSSGRPYGQVPACSPP